MRKEFVILGLVIAVLLGVLFVQKRNKVHYTIPDLESFEVEQISKVVLSKAGEEILIQKSGEHWQMGPEGYKADEKKISQITDQLSNLSLSALVSEREHYQVYDLTEEKKITVKAYAGEEPIRNLAIGKAASSQRHTFVLLEGDKNVYQASGNLRTFFDQDMVTLRDMTVMSFDDEIMSVDISTGVEKINIHKGMPVADPDTTSAELVSAEPEWLDEEGVKLKQSKVSEMINALKNLSAEAYIEGKSKEEMKSPSYTLTLHGTKDYVISLFEKTEENQYSAVSSESPYPFYLAEWKAKRFMAERNDLKEEKDS